MKIMILDNTQLTAHRNKDNRFPTSILIQGQEFLLCEGTDLVSEFFQLGSQLAIQSPLCNHFIMQTKG